MKKIIMALALSGIVPASGHASCYSTYEVRVSHVYYGNAGPQEAALALAGTGTLTAGYGAAVAATGVSTVAAGVATAATGGAALVTGGVAAGITTTTESKEVADLESVMALIKESNANAMGGLQVVKLQQELASLGIQQSPSAIASAIREVDDSGLLCSERLLKYDEVRDLIASRLTN